MDLFPHIEELQIFETKLKTCLIKGFQNEDPKIFEECMYNTNFPFFCVEDINDQAYCSEEFNHYYLVNYWFEGCSGCIREKPFLMKLSQEFPSLKIISLSRDSRESFNNILLEKLDWVCVADYESKNIPRNMGGYPLTFLIDSEGKICIAFMSGIQNEIEFNRTVSQLVEK